MATPSQPRPTVNNPTNPGRQSFSAVATTRQTQQQPQQGSSSSQRPTSASQPTGGSHRSSLSSGTGSGGMHPPAPRNNNPSMVRIGPPVNVNNLVRPGPRPPDGAASRATRSSSDEELNKKYQEGGVGAGPRGSTSGPAQKRTPNASTNPFADAPHVRGPPTRPINTQSVPVDTNPFSNTRNSQPHSAGSLTAGRMNRSSSGGSLSTLPQTVSPPSGSAAAAYALSAGLDTSPSLTPPANQPRPGHSLTVTPNSTASLFDTSHGDPYADIPAEVECFENQRCYPVVGWSKNLLPTDRPTWSNDEGTQARQLTDFKCPLGWSWVGDWQIYKDYSSTGTQGTTDSDGWSYAVEFTRPYHGEAVKQPKHQVRRRRWFRKRQLTEKIPKSNNVSNSKTHTAKTRSDNKAGTTKLVTTGGVSLTVGSSSRGGRASSPPIQTRPTSASMTLNPRSAGNTASAPSLSSLYAPPPARVTQPNAAPKPVATQLVKVVEYQRYYPIVGWSDKLLPTDPKHPWTDAKGNKIQGKEEIKPDTGTGTKKKKRHKSAGDASDAKTHQPEEEVEDDSDNVYHPNASPWQWLTEWKVDMTANCDAEGWSYSVDFPHSKWYSRKSLEMFVRKRIWYREKGRMEIKKDHKKIIQNILAKLDALEKDREAEEKDEQLVSLKSATW